MAKLFDFTCFVGDMFSQLSVYILLSKERNCHWDKLGEITSRKMFCFFLAMF